MASDCDSGNRTTKFRVLGGDKKRRKDKHGLCGFIIIQCDVNLRATVCMIICKDEYVYEIFMSIFLNNNFFSFIKHNETLLLPFIVLLCTVLIT